MSRATSSIPLALCILILIATAAAAADSLDRALVDAVSGLDESRIPTGILYDRVLGMSRIEEFDGRPGSPAISLREWKQIYFEMSNASISAPAWPAVARVVDDGRTIVRQGRIPLALMLFNYNRIRRDAIDTGLIEIRDGRVVDTGRGNPFEQSMVFASAALEDKTYRGNRVVFGLDNEFYFTNDGRLLRRIEMDFDDGGGWQNVRLGGSYVAHYPVSGNKNVRVRVRLEDGQSVESSFVFEVVSLQAPAPNDTLAITATIPYNSEFGTGEAYVYLSSVNTVLSQPVILVEGFDIGNTMNWDELYELINQEGLVDSLRGSGYDVVVLNFTDALEYIQKNAFVLIELLQQVQAMILPLAEYSLVGASMGGLVARYALAYMETNSLPHRVRLFMSFDSPQNGANIPLGVQHWVDFFSGQSTEAADLLLALNSPAARQMLVYHHTVLPTTTAGSDPLRAALEVDLTAVGDYPSVPRKVAVSNGSSTQLDQGFAPGAQVVDYSFSNLLVTLVGDVWAVSAGPLQTVFDGQITIFLIQNDLETIAVSGTASYDNAPGGYRSSMADMDSTVAPYGDIIALHPNHCFIPTISALDLATTDLFYDVAGDANLLSMTPFDDVCVPLNNEEHVTITPDNAVWILDELRPVLTAIGGPSTPRATTALSQNIPNPFNPLTTIRYELPTAGHVRVDVFAVDGSAVVTLVDESMPAGPHEVVWNGRDRSGQAVASGIYFYRLESPTARLTRKMVVLK